MTKLGLALVLTLTAACANAFVRSIASSPYQTSTASQQAMQHFDAMLRAADSTGLEQAACVSAWTFSLRNGTLSMHISRVRPALVHRAHADSIRFECYQGEGTVHTHSMLCTPSDTDRTGNEMFGVVVCPRPTRFAIFAVTPRRP